MAPEANVLVLARRRERQNKNALLSALHGLSRTAQALTRSFAPLSPRAAAAEMRGRLVDRIAKRADFARQVSAVHASHGLGLRLMSALWGVCWIALRLPPSVYTPLETQTLLLRT